MLPLDLGYLVPADDSVRGCPHKKECIKGRHSNTPLEERNKNLYISKKFVQYRTEDLARIASEEECELRMNRSIQVEGSFGDIKHLPIISGNCITRYRKKRLGSIFSR